MVSPPAGTPYADACDCDKPFVFQAGQSKKCDLHGNFAKLGPTRS